jgi:hypothetical protein
MANPNELMDEELISLAHALFITEQGKRFLNLLSEKYLMAPVFIPQFGDAQAHIREGENNLIRQFMSWRDIQEQRIYAEKRDKEAAENDLLKKPKRQRKAMRIDYV